MSVPSKFLKSSKSPVKGVVNLKVTSCPGFNLSVLLHWGSVSPSFPLKFLYPILELFPSDSNGTDVLVIFASPSFPWFSVETVTNKYSEEVFSTNFTFKSHSIWFVVGSYDPFKTNILFLPSAIFLSIPVVNSILWSLTSLLTRDDLSCSLLIAKLLGVLGLLEI